MFGLLFDLLVRAYFAFIVSLGTTTLGFIVGNVVLALFTLLVTHFVRRAKGDVKESTRKELEVGLIVYAVVFMAVFVPIYCYHLFIVAPRTIRIQSASVVVPVISTKPSVPPFWSLKSSPQQHRQPESSAGLVKLILKDSPVLSESRKAHITAVINAYAQYLTKVGFTLPRDTPPIGVVPGNVMMWSAWSPGTSFDAELRLPANKIDDPATIRALYSQWIFAGVVFHNSPFQIAFSNIYECYFVSSFVNHPLCDNTSAHNWNTALWKIRQQQGKEYTDAAMVYTIKGWHERVDLQSFNGLFSSNLLRAIGLRDGDDHHRVLAAEAILTKDGLMK